MFLTRRVMISPCHGYVTDSQRDRVVCNVAPSVFRIFTWWSVIPSRFIPAVLHLLPNFMHKRTLTMLSTLMPAKMEKRGPGPIAWMHWIENAVMMAATSVRKKLFTAIALALRPGELSTRYTDEALNAHICPIPYTKSDMRGSHTATPFCVLHP